MFRVHKNKGSALISILILFALVFSTAFYISKDLLDFKKSQVKYELLGSRDLLVEQMKQYMYNPVVIGISAVLQELDSTTNDSKYYFRRCVDSTYNEKQANSEKCESLFCSKNDLTCSGKPIYRPFRAYSPISRTSDLSFQEICKSTNADDCDYVNITGVDLANPVKYRIDGTACLEATPGPECVFWIYAQFFCDNSPTTNPSNTPCHAKNKNIFVEVTLVHATAYPRPTAILGTTAVATVSSESIIDKNRLNTQDIVLSYIPVAEIKDTHLYLCPNNPAPACAAGVETTTGKKLDGCPCNRSKSSVCPVGLVCGTAAAASAANKCCPCTCPDQSTLMCGSAQALAAYGCPCTCPTNIVCGSAQAVALPMCACTQNKVSSCSPPGMSCSDPGYKPGCPCVNLACDISLYCTDTNYKPGCPCKEAPAMVCPAVPLNCDDAGHIKGCPCNDIGVCTGPHICNSPAALAEPTCSCSCPTNFITGSPESIAHPGCVSNRASTCPGGLICGTPASLANTGCACTPPTCNASLSCTDPVAINNSGCNCTEIPSPSCPPAGTLICGSAAALLNKECPCDCPAAASLTCSTNMSDPANVSPGCPSTCPSNIICGSATATSFPGCVCQCPGVTPTCLKDGSGNYTVTPVAGCPCNAPPPPPPPPDSGS